MNYLKGISLNELPPKSSYIHSLPVVKHLSNMNELHFSSPVTFLVGENGSGKSTLLEAIAVAMGFNAEGGGRNFTFSTNNSHSDLWKYIDTLKSVPARDGYFLRAESLYNLASNIDEMDNEPSFDPPVIQSYGGVSLHKQSHGESFLSLIQNRFGGNGLYILDEPEAALSPNRLMSLLIVLDRLVKKNSQFIIATHSPILMSYPNSEILELSEDGIKAASLRDTDHYKITKQFLDRPEQMMKYLLDEK